MKINKFGAAIAVGLTCFAGQALAADGLAQMSAVKGSLAVNRGGKIAPVSAGTSLRAGDRVMSINGGSGKIKFADGCVVDIAAKGMATVGAKSPCSAGLVNSSAPMQFGLEGFAGAAAVFGVGALLVAAYAASEDDDDEDFAISP